MSETGEGSEGAAPEKTHGRGDADDGGGDEAAPAERKRIARERLDAWGKVYGTEHRQIRRWMERGRETGDAPPLDTPAAMPAWWGRNMRQRVPAKILAASRDAAATTSPGGGAPEGPPPPPTPVEVREGVTLADYELSEGDEVRQARRLVAVAYVQLERAYAPGGTGDIELLHRKHERAMKALDMAEKAERQVRKDQGLLISRAAIEHDVAAACEMLRQMRESMARRVVERCAGLTAEQRAEVAATIIEVRAHEDRILQQLETLTQPHDFTGLLAA